MRRIAFLLLLTAGATAADDDPPPFQRDDFTVWEVGGNRVFPLLEARGQWVTRHFLLKTNCPYSIRHTHDYTMRADEVPGVVHVFLKPDTEEEIAAWSLNLADRLEQDAAVTAEMASRHLPRSRSRPGDALRHPRWLFVPQAEQWRQLCL
jgi:hypothetical protein